MEAAPKMRMTTQRRVILEELRKLKTHPTAGELCRIVRRRVPRISLGTVYRNLDILSRTGHIQKLEVAGLERRFDGNVENHYHVRCQLCGKVDDIELDLLDGLEAQAARQSGYALFSHRLEFSGLCPHCQDKAPA